MSTWHADERKDEVSMSKPSGATLVEPDSPTGDAQPTPKRINVAINSATLRAIEIVMDREQISLTEAVRRLVAYGDYIYRAIKDDGSRLVMRHPDGSEREIVILT